jgi:hypothetical protein
LCTKLKKNIFFKLYMTCNLHPCVYCKTIRKNIKYTGFIFCVNEWGKFIRYLLLKNNKTYRGKIILFLCFFTFLCIVMQLFPLKKYISLDEGTFVFLRCKVGELKCQKIAHKKHVYTFTYNIFFAWYFLFQYIFDIIS